MAFLRRASRLPPVARRSNRPRSDLDADPADRQNRPGPALSKLGFFHDDRLLTLSWPMVHCSFEQASASLARPMCPCWGTSSRRLARPMCPGWGTSSRRLARPMCPGWGTSSRRLARPMCPGWGTSSRRLARPMCPG
eukprot:365203-Chlamydomonas_euryale.AAC.9